MFGPKQKKNYRNQKLKFTTFIMTKNIFKPKIEYFTLNCNY